jgi:hypothetical protein
MSQDGVHSIESGDLDFNNILDIKLVGDYIWLLQDRGVHIMRSKALAVSAINDYHYLKYNDTLHSTLTANAKNQLTPEGRLYIYLPPWACCGWTPKLLTPARRL